MKRGKVGTVLGLALVALTSKAALATTITFEDLGVARGSQLNPAPGVGVVSFGYNYTPGPNNASLSNDLHMDNGSFGPDNGTTSGGSHDDVVLTRVGGAVFSLQGFDFAGLFLEGPFSVVGTLSGGGTMTANFTPDGISDNIGPLVDFQRFTVGAEWTNLTSVTWNHSGGLQGLFYLDNITVDEAVPEPASVLLVGAGLGLIGVMAGRKWNGRSS